MDSKLKAQRKVLAAKAKAEPKSVSDKKGSQKKNGKTAEKLQMPKLVAGKEVLGRKLSVIKTTKKEAIWVKGAVKEFDEPTIRHKIKYDLPLPEVINEREEWLCLSSSGFMWKEDDFVCPYANPTYSSKYTPKKEDAIGKRVKVFWTAMSKWYQGKVVDYDSVTGKHRVSFRDGEQNHYLLQQEALVWLDIPELNSDAALKRMRSEEGHPVAIIRNDENQAPVERKSKLVAADKNLRAVANAAKCRHRQARAAEEAAKSCGQDAPNSKRLQKQAKSPQPKKGKEASAAVTKIGKIAVGIPNATTNAMPDAKRRCVEDTKRPPVTTATEALSEQGNSPKAATASQGNKSISIVANGNAKPVGKGTTKGPVKAAPEQGSRKRSRLGDPALTSTACVSPEAKKGAIVKTGAVVKTAQAAPKQGRKPKGLGGESRLKRQKTESDLKFESCCQNVIGSRIGVWWEDDHCFYKGKIINHDWLRKKLKICYDDGVEEYIQPQKEDTQFKWLTPRALTAGATDAVHLSFQLLGASNAGLPVPQSDVAIASDGRAGTPQSDLLAAAHIADGSHLDALVPMQVNGNTGPKGEISQKGAEAEAPGPHPIDSTTRAMSLGAKGTASLLSAAMNGAQQLNGIPASTAGLILTGLQSMLSPSNGFGLGLPKSPIGAASILPPPLSKQMLLAKGGVNPILQPSILQSPNNAASQPESVSNIGKASSCPKGEAFEGPKEAAAEGWKVSLVFRGDHQQYQGRVIAYKAETKQHLVLWEDGEDEWIDIEKESLTWHSDRGKSTGFSAGLPAGQDSPSGEKLKGWCLAVFWKYECKFFDGIVVDYDGDLDQHTIHYSDGEERCESVTNLIFKYVLPPNVQPVGSRRIQPSRKWQDSGSDREATPAFCSQRRQRRRRGASQEDDTDEEWTGGKGNVIERRITKPAHYVPPIRHLSLSQRQHSHLQPHVSSPMVNTPGGSEIRRLNSKCGSLLFFEGEENPAVSPAPSPKTSPHSNSATKLDAVPSDGKPRAVLDRKVMGLKSALGFRMGVKRVRLYLQSLPPESEQSKPALPSGKAAPKRQLHAKPFDLLAAAKQEEGDLSSWVPDRKMLKLMLDRVEAASLSMQTGGLLPLPSSAVPKSDPGGPFNSSTAGGAGPVSQVSPSSKTILQLLPTETLPFVPLSTSRSSSLGKDALATVDQNQQNPSASSHQEQQHTTPPPSPFASYFNGSGSGGDSGPPLEDLQLDVPDNADAATTSFRNLAFEGFTQPRVSIVEAQRSLSRSPDTPSAGEQQIMALSRKGSAISDPLLAELLQCKMLSCKGQASLEDNHLSICRPE